MGHWSNPTTSRSNSHVGILLIYIPAVVVVVVDAGVEMGGMMIELISMASLMMAVVLECL